MDISATSNLTSNAARFLDGTAATPPKQVLDQADFLKLLTTQLTAQDPLKPMEDTQFIAQMANFSSLEQMRSLSADFAKLASAQQFSSAQNLLGRTVTLNATDGEITGAVSEVSNANGLLRVVVGGKEYDPADVIRVLGATTPAAAQ